jgi:hypothetical protein
MSLAGEFFGEHDSNARLNISSAEALWDWVLAGGADRLTSDSWPLSPGVNLFFRGQPNVEYGLSSSLYRLCRTQRSNPEPGVPSRLDERVLEVAERAIVAAMRDEGIGRNMTEGELLAVLQHHGIPTRLVDVSKAPLEALFFAVDQEHSADGRLFMLHIHPDESGQVDTISFADKETLEWEGTAHGTLRTKADWTERVAIVDQAPLDARMRAQGGRFLVGGLNKRYAGQAYKCGGRYVPAEQYAEISTLSINFLGRMVGKPNAQWQATGWTVRVESTWKSELLKRLSSVGISHDTMYPPLGEVRRLALSVAKDAVAQQD